MLLRHGEHFNAHLQSSWRKYKEAAFQFSVIEELQNPERLIEREQYWLQRYFEMPNAVFNKTRFARAPNRGVACSPETRRKISKTLTGRKNGPLPEETKRKISEAHRGKVGHSQTEETRSKIAIGLAKAYPAFIHQETGEIISAGKNLEALSRERGFHSGHMSEVKAGKRQSHKGWRRS